MIHFEILYREIYKKHIESLNLTFEDIKILRNKTLKESKDLSNKRKHFAFQEYLVFNQLYNKMLHKNLK